MANRDIKFRAWDNHEKKWLMGYEYPNLGGFSMFGECMLFEEWSNVLNKFILQQRDRKYDDLKLMQYSGENDKTGKLIYESDIVKCGYGTGVVIFHAGCFMVEWIDDKESEMEFLFSRKGRSARDEYESFEIIGNIYQHPNLLKS
jgi:uncharacterized phage protein (TIGR01671 family)